MTVCRHCSATWTGLKISHCAECHNTFTTTANFDKHRAGMRPAGGPPLVSGVCHNPELNWLVLNDRGQWAAPAREVGETEAGAA